MGVFWELAMEALAAAVEVEVGFAVEGRVEVFPAVGVVWRSLGRWEVGVVGSLPNARGERVQRLILTECRIPSSFRWHDRANHNVSDVAA